jgi:hypothetical protein
MERTSRERAVSPAPDLTLRRDAAHLEDLGASHAMSKSHLILLKTACWVVVGGFVLGSVAMHRLFVEAARPDSGIWCGNSVTDPLGALLSFGTPLSVVAVVPLGVLWRRGLAAAWSVVPASLLVLVCTASLLVVGIRFFRDFLPGFHLSDIVWWMSPVGGVFGV